MQQLAETIRNSRYFVSTEQLAGGIKVKPVLLKTTSNDQCQGRSSQNTQAEDEAPTYNSILHTLLSFLASYHYKLH